MDTVLIGAFLGLGAIVGSFLGVIAERAHTGQSWARGRSRCNSCRTHLGVPDLIPVVSWVWHRGRCRHCKSRVPFQYPALELTLAVTWASAYALLGLSPAFVCALIAFSALYYLVIYDLRHMIVSFMATGVLLGAGIGYQLASQPIDVLPETFVRAILIGIGFVAVYFLSRGRALGLGDAPVAVALSVLLGGRSLIGLLFSFWVGGVIGIFILFLRRGGPRMGIEVPFVPFMAAGYLLAFFTQWNPLPF